MGDQTIQSVVKNGNGDSFSVNGTGIYTGSAKKCGPYELTIEDLFQALTKHSKHESVEGQIKDAWKNLDLHFAQYDQKNKFIIINKKHVFNYTDTTQQGVKQTQNYIEDTIGLFGEFLFEKNISQ